MFYKIIHEIEKLIILEGSLYKIKRNKSSVLFTTIFIKFIQIHKNDIKNNN